MLLASWTLDKISKWVRSFNAENLGSVDQRAAKIPSVKLWEWFDPGTTQTRAPSKHFQRLTAGNFEALWSKDLKFSAFIDLFLFSIVWKVKKPGSILRLSFALSKWPHFHRVYLVTVCKRSSIAVPEEITKYHNHFYPVILVRVFWLECLTDVGTI